MDSKTAKEIDRLLFKYSNERNMVAVNHWIDKHIAEDFIDHSTDFGQAPDKNGFRERFKIMTELGLTIEQNEMVFENDVLCFRFTAHIDGKPVSVGLAMAKFKDEKMIERWGMVQTL